jgi:hypothetical protein
MVVLILQSIRLRLIALDRAGGKFFYGDGVDVA